MSRGPKLAEYLALAYTLVIVYASLRPFAGWRMPPDPVLHFLTAPWPRYITAADIAINIGAYLPLGALLFFALRPPLAAAFAFLAATIVAAALSLALESAQMFLPTRIASNVDLISNTAGAAIGALGALLLTIGNNPLDSLRRRMLRADALGDWGLLVVALWIVIQFHPAPLAFSSGDFRDALGIRPMFQYTSQAYWLAETAVVGLAVVVLGLLISLITQSRRYTGRVMLVTMALTIAAKSIAAASLTRSANWLQWVTPGIAAGFTAGVILLAVFMFLALRRRAAVAALCLLAGVFLVNITPDNPYLLVPPFMIGIQQTHLTNFGSILRALSQIWPLAALLLLLALTRAGSAQTAH